MEIYFYGTKDHYGCFSNFSAHGVTIDGEYWPTTEHYFQAQKFVGTEHEKLIQRVQSPRDAARLGRERKPHCAPIGKKSKMT